MYVYNVYINKYFYVQLYVCTLYNRIEYKIDKIKIKLYNY